MSSAFCVHSSFARGQFRLTNTLCFRIHFRDQAPASVCTLLGPVELEQTLGNGDISRAQEFKEWNCVPRKPSLHFDPKLWTPGPIGPGDFSRKILLCTGLFLRNFSTSSERSLFGKTNPKYWRYFKVLTIQTFRIFVAPSNFSAPAD